jgi:alkylation response protein AidB-like acyl-CoA dehydrogenase
MHESLAPLRRVVGRLAPLETPADVAHAVSSLVESGQLDLPLPGAGNTALRYGALAEIAAVDLSLARLAEGHTDALAILAEAGRGARPGTYGVWAAEPPDARVRAERVAAGFRLTGRKRFASGARRLDRALVTAEASDGGRLFDVDLRAGGVTVVPDTWQAVGMAATESLEVLFEGALVGEEARVGEAGFYLSRPGFWHGAVGVAACWYGGALGAFRLLRHRLRAGSARPDEHQLAHLGAVAVTCGAMRSALDVAAANIDGDPLDHLREAHARALQVRQLVEQGCQEVLGRVGRAGGTSPLVFDRAHARRAADLVVYLRQHHAERDLAELGRLVLAEEA